MMLAVRDTEDTDSLHAPYHPATMKTESVEISVHGHWVQVPAVECDGRVIAVVGRWLKVAVIQDEDFSETEVHDPGACIQVLKEHRSQRGLRTDLFTFTQKPPETRPKFSYHMERDSLAVLRTDRFKEWWDKLPQESRKNVRRAERRGVVTLVKQCDDALIAGIVDLNNDSAVRQGRKFVHYRKTFDQVKKDQAAFLGRSDYVCAYLGSELIGFLKVAYRGDVASIVQVLPKSSHQDKRPANALIAKAVELCQDQGVSYLTYGLFNYGKRRDSSLREFKIRNGFEEMLVPRFYIPLTSWGDICVKLRLYRGLLELLPDKVTRVGSRLRSKWHGLRHLTERAG
jgi:hypothetical protein